MNPVTDPDLQPTTSGPDELRYFNVLSGILDQCRQTGLCVCPSHYVGTCYAFNLPPSLAGDSRVLPQAMNMDTAIANWAAANNLALVITTWPQKVYTFYPL